MDEEEGKQGEQYSHRSWPPLFSYCRRRDVEYKTRLDCSIVEVVVDGPLKTILSWVREFSERLVAWSAAAGGGGGGIVLGKSCGWEFN